MLTRRRPLLMLFVVVMLLAAVAVFAQDDKPSPPAPLPGGEPLATPTVFDPAYPDMPTLIPTATATATFGEAAPLATPTAALEVDAPEGGWPPESPAPYTPVDFPAAPLPVEPPILEAQAFTSFNDPRTWIGATQAVIAPADVAQLYTLVQQAPLDYTIYLLEGVYELSQTLRTSRSLKIYGRGRDLTILQPNPNSPPAQSLLYLYGGPTRHVVTLSHVRLQNSRFSHGGAVTVNGSGNNVPYLLVYDSEFRGNQGTYGGAIYNYRGVLGTSRTLFKDNQATGTGFGGAIFTDDAWLYPLIRASRFEGNRAQYGGGIYHQGSRSPSLLENSSFVDNGYGYDVHDHFYNNSQWSAPAQQTWWALPSVSPYGGDGVDSRNPLTSDPGVIAAQPPEPLPDAPTPTPAPTVTPSATPTPRPLLQVEYYPGFSVLDAAIREQVLSTTLENWSIPAPIDPDRFTSLWRGDIFFALPVTPITPTATFTGTPTITPTPRPVNPRYDVTLCVETTILPAPHVSRLKIWLDRQLLEMERLEDSWCTFIDDLIFGDTGFNGGWRDFVIEYWRYAEPGMTFPPPRFILTWEVVPFQGTEIILPREIFPPAHLRLPTNSNSFYLGSLSEQAICVGNGGVRRLRAVPVYPGNSQETTDMLAVVNEDGLIIHDGPTWNAAQFGVIPWGSAVHIDRRMVFEQTGETLDQVWYRIAPDSQYFDINNDRWINVRTQNYFYAVGMGAEDDSGSPFCDAISTMAENETMTFVYDRQAAAEYGMAHAYRNSTLDTDLVYPDNQNRVTSRLDGNNPAVSVAGGTVANPFANSFLRYAYFFYPQQVTGETGFTGSAMFTSEAIWMGGLPMTFDFESVEVSCPSVGTAQSGWRYCSQDEVASFAWRAHAQQTNYYSSNGNSILNSDRGVLADNVFATGDPESDERARLNRIAGNHGGQGFPNLTAETNRVEFYNQYLNPENVSARTFTGIQNVQQGDYLYINRSDPNTGHGFLVIGWGDITSCPDALDQVWIYTSPVNENYGQLFHRFEASNTELIVPYVVDFSGGVNTGQLQRPRPRPFYCAQYNDDDGDQDLEEDSFILRDTYQFLAYPFTLVTINANQLYVPLVWNWGD